MNQLEKHKSLNLDWAETQLPILDFSEFGFSVESESLAAAYSEDAAHVHAGAIEFADERVEFNFRVQRVSDSVVRCRYFDLPIKTREQLLQISKIAAKETDDELHDLTYDELAEGKTKKQVDDSAKKQSLKSGTSTIKKAVATFVLCGIIMGICVWLVVLLRSRSTVAVTRAVMVGNYQPVNTPFEGHILDLKVAVGDRVEEGDVLAVLDNPTGIEELEEVKAKLFRAKRELEAHTRYAGKIKATLPIVKAKFEQDMTVARAELEKIDAESRAATSQLNRLLPLHQANNIPIAEFEEVESLVALAKADRVRQLAVIKSLEFRQEAIDSNMIITETVADPLSEAQREIDLSQASVDELEALMESIENRIKPTELFAPSAGTVYAIYHRPGEYLKAAEEALALSLDDKAWAMGHIETDAAADVKPGLPVEVEIPSLGITTTGIVSGIGHRSVYGRGGYNADFRAGPLDVPIRVSLEALEQQVPSGLRLEMTVRVHDHLKAIRTWVNEKLGRTEAQAVTQLQEN